MKTLKIKYAGIICILSLIFFCLPQDSMAQRFGHGGGGGAPRGGGGAPRGGGGGVMRGGGGARDGGGSRPVQVFRGGGFNGGSHVEGHVFHAPAPARGFGIRHNEGVYHHVYGTHPYAFHAYHPYVWGPYWHPFGFFAATLTANAFLFSIANQQYYYDNGVYYEPSGGGYSVVAPPVGAVVNYLPAGYLTVPMGDDTYFYYGGAFYVSQGGSFRVVPAPIGAIVTEIPEGATDQQINGEDYLLYNNTYYQPISQDGQDAYEVVQLN